MKKTISILILVLFISGCTTLSDLFRPKQETKEMPEDVITVENVNVLPIPPIIAGDQFSVSFQLTNVEEKQEIPTSYQLLDDGLCSLVSGQADSEDLGLLVPGQVEFREWTFRTPQSSEIAYLKAVCPVRFKVNYTFFSESEIEVNVISRERYMQLQQSGTFETFTPTLTVGRGPIKIYMEFGATLPLRSGSILPVYMTVEDRGSGLFEEVSEGKLFLQVPNDVNNNGFTIYDCGAMEFYQGSETFVDYDNYDFYRNRVAIPLIAKKTYKIKCSLNVPEVDTEQTYFLNAYFQSYEYDIIKQVDVEIQPLAA